MNQPYRQKLSIMAADDDHLETMISFLVVFLDVAEIIVSRSCSNTDLLIAHISSYSVPDERTRLVLKH